MQISLDILNSKILNRERVKRSSVRHMKEDRKIKTMIIKN